MIDYDRDEIDGFDVDEDEIDALPDFDSRSFWKPRHRASHDYLDNMWGRWGFNGTLDQWGRQRVNEEDILIAHGMVQSFVNAFARDGFYSVVFDKNAKTAGTDLDRRLVVLTTAPIVDEDLTPQQAGRILTGLAAHEISHPRFGKDTAWAVRAAFKQSSSANRISNLLDDVRIERRFIEAYPGYAGVFEPTLEYVSRGLMKRNGDKLVKPRMDDQLNLMTLAIRYESCGDWTGLEDERDWWKDWARRWQTEDSPRRHVEAVREALRHIVSVKVEIEVARQKTITPIVLGQSDEGTSDSTGDGAGQAGDETGDTPAEDAASDGSGDGAGEDEKIDAASVGQSSAASQETANDEELDGAIAGLDDNELAEAADEHAPVGPQAPTCAGRQAVETAAANAGVDRSDISRAEEMAQKAVENAKFYEDDGHGSKVDVARSMKKLVNSGVNYRYSRHFVKSDIASRYIRDALLRSRTGHTAVSHYQKRGRLDQRSLHRVAERDYRLFDRKHAPSPGRFRVWMLLDRSGSMDGIYSMQQAQVATAIADASRHVPSMQVAVWAWSDKFRNKAAYYDSTPGVALAWQTGQPTSEIKRTIDLPSGGTPDAQIMGWAWRAIKRETRQGETPVLIMCSDGWGSGILGERVREARAAGVQVVSVAFGNLDEESQRERFGRDGYVAWQGDIVATSRPLARMIARIVGRDTRRHA